MPPSRFGLILLIVLLAAAATVALAMAVAGTVPPWAGVAASLAALIAAGLARIAGRRS